MSRPIEVGKCINFIKMAKCLPNWRSDQIIDKYWYIRRLRIYLSWRNSKGVMGRFGGGWNWKVGIQWSARNVHLSLLIMELSFYFKKKEAKQIMAGR